MHIWRDRILRLSTVLNMRHRPILFDMDIETVGFKVLGNHHARLDDAVLLGEVSLAEALRELCVSQRAPIPLTQPGRGGKVRTVSSDFSSSSFFPTSLFDHSAVLSSDWVVTPGTTRGIFWLRYSSWCVRADGCRYFLWDDRWKGDYTVVAVGEDEYIVCDVSAVPSSCCQTKSWL